jgi:hypothetical protein
MKNLKTLTRIATLIAIMFVSTVALNAMNPPATMSIANAEIIQKTLDQAVNFPQEAGVTGTVKAQLNIDENGKVTVEEINGQPELTAHVAKQLENVTFEDYSLTGKTFIAKFDFRK